VSIEVLERMFAAFEEDGVEGVLEYIDPEAVAVIGPELSAEPDTYRGHDGVTVRGGKAVRVEAFVDLESAREAAP
jgi:hypothetical protein